MTVNREAISVGVPLEIAPGIFLLRLPLPFRLNHINVYIFDDGDGWTVFDTGVATDECRDIWNRVLSTTFAAKPITRLIVSHFHVDHVGLAGWLYERGKPEFWMSQTEYLMGRVVHEIDSHEHFETQARFFHRYGFDIKTANTMARGRPVPRSLRSDVPDSFGRLRAGDTLRLAGRDWRVLTGGGHSPELVMLYCAADKIFLSADQVLIEISPNVGVRPIMPNADPLREFIDTLTRLETEVADDVLVLPGHRTPFSGLHTRLIELVQHHEARCAAIVDGAQGKWLTGVELVPLVFGRNFGPEVVSLAVSEAIAHANYLVSQGRMTTDTTADGTLRYRVA